MKTRLTILALFTYFLFGTSSIQAGPLVGIAIKNTGFPVEVNVPRGKAMVIVSFTLVTDSRTPVSTGSGAVFVDDKTGIGNVLVLTAAPVDIVSLDQGPTGRQVTIPGPAKVSTIVGGASNGTPAVGYLVYKLNANGS